MCVKLKCPHAIISFFFNCVFYYLYFHIKKFIIKKILEEKKWHVACSIENVFLYIIMFFVKTPHQIKKRKKKLQNNIPIKRLVLYISPFKVSSYV